MARTLFPTFHMPEEHKKMLICIIKSGQKKKAENTRFLSRFDKNES